MLEEIRRLINDGARISHVLNVKVVQQDDNETGVRIFQAMNGIPQLAEILPGVQMSITWTSIQQSSAYYFADVPDVFSSTAVDRHTQMILTKLCTQADVFTRGNMPRPGLCYMIFKPVITVGVRGFINLAVQAQGQGQDDEEEEEAQVLRCTVA